MRIPTKGSSTDIELGNKARERADVMAYLMMLKLEGIMSIDPAVGIE
tara:strand:- start:181 stop:321 length:141 start_codon:yes stop_codon:yes gene_type:complete